MALSKRLSVLLVDDDENDVFLIRRALDRLGMIQRLIPLPDAERAIAYLSGQGKFADRLAWPVPNLLILDHGLPCLSGLDLLCWLRRERGLELMPVVLLSGGLTPGQSELAGRLRAVRCGKASDTAVMSEGIAEAIHTALAMFRQAWFGARAAYEPPESLAASPLGPIRVWT